VALDDSLTLREAAERTGLTQRALARRIERGSLPATKRRDGLRRVKLRDLVAAGLLDPNSGERPPWSREPLDPAELARQVVETLTRQAIDLQELSERMSLELERAEREREQLRQKIAEMDEDRAALRRELAELRRRRS
jgi:excisionase family DNA binding protein